MSRLTATNRYVVRNFSSALAFTGGTSFGTIAGSTSLNPVGNGANFWVYLEFKCSRNQTGAVIRLLGKNDSGGAKYPFAVRVNTAGKLEAVIFNGTTSVAPLSTKLVDDGRWHRALVYYAQVSSTVTIYLDTGQDGTATGAVAGADQSNTGGIFIGRRNGETPTFPGVMQTIGVGVGTLDTTAINNILFNGKFPTGGTMIVNIPSTDGSGNSATDVSGNSNNATLTSPVWTTSSFSKSRGLRP